MDLEYHELLKVCESLNIEIIKEMALTVEKETMLRSSSKLWFRYRAGRVTASRIKAVCRTDASKPSQSLVKSICFPESFCFTSKQTTWGCKHEKSAHEHYMVAVKGQHANFTIRDSGLVINPLWPLIGPPPDGVISCTCCGQGTLEIKCPYCHRGESVEFVASEDNKFCLKTTSDGTELGLVYVHQDGRRVIFT